MPLVARSTTRDAIDNEDDDDNDECEAISTLLSSRARTRSRAITFVGEPSETTTRNARVRAVVVGLFAVIYLHALLLAAFGCTLVVALCGTSCDAQALHVYELCMHVFNISVERAKAYTQPKI